MARSIAKLLNVRSREIPRIVILYGMAFLFFTGITWGQTILEPSFLFYVGLDKLGQVFTTNAIISIVIIAVYTGFVDRIPNDRLLIFILLFSGAAIGGGLLLIGPRPALAYLLLYILVRVIKSAFLLHWWTYVGTFYDTRSAKRIVPVISSASRLAIVFAGLTTPILNRLLSGPAIIGMWIGLLGVVAGVSSLMPTLLTLMGAEDQANQANSRQVARPTAGPAGQRDSYLQNVREGFRYVSKSVFLRWMVLSTLVMVLIFALFNYRGGQIFTARFATREALSSYLGYLTAGTSLVMFLIQVFLLSRIIARIGLGNANLIFPIGTLAISGVLITFPTSPVSASLAYFDRQAFRFAIRETSNDLLYNAVPLRVKGRARAFINGLVIPIGLLLSSAMLWLLRSAPAGWTWLSPGLVGTLALIYVISAFAIRKRYSQALISMLEQEDFSFLLASTPELAVTDATTLNWLKKKLEESSGDEFTVFVANLIGEVGGNEAVPILLQIARTHNARVRTTILEILATTGVWGEDPLELYAEFRADPDARVRRAAIAGLEQWTGPESEDFLEQALELLNDSDVEVRAQVIPALIRSGDFFYLASAIQTLSQMVADDDPQQRAQGIRVLSQVGDVRFTRNLVRYLDDVDDRVRLEAAVGIESLTQQGIPERMTSTVVQRLETLAGDPADRVRQAALSILGRIGTQEALQAAIPFLTDSNPETRDQAVETLAQSPDEAIPLLLPAVDGGDVQLRRMATVTLCRIDRERFGHLVQSRIHDGLREIYHNRCRLDALSPYTDYPSIGVLERVLQEENNRLMDETFYLLSASHDPEAVHIIAESLLGETAHVRANAVEALESLTTPQMAALIAPLFDPKAPATQLSQIAADTYRLSPRDTLQTVNELITDPQNPWLRAITTFALGEIGAALVEQKEQVVPTQKPGEEQKKRDKQSPRAIDLLDKLIGDAEEKTTEPKQERPQIRRARPSPPLDRLTQAYDQPLLALEDIEAILRDALNDPVADVHTAARAAKQMIAGERLVGVISEEEAMLSTIERVIFLKEVPFFQGLTIDQLKVLAGICEEELIEEDTQVFAQGDPSGTMYVVISGQVAIEREGQREGSVVRLATIEPRSYFGEMSLFDRSPRSAAATALQDTLCLSLHREPLMALVRQHPDLSLELIYVISQRLREANDRIAKLTRSRPRELEKLYDSLGGD